MSSKSVNSIVTDVAKTFGVTKAKILSESRESPKVASARQVAIYVHHFRNRSTKRATAKAFGRKPPTVTHSIATVIARMKSQRKFKATVTKLAGA